MSDIGSGLDTRIQPRPGGGLGPARPETRAGGGAGGNPDRRLPELTGDLDTAFQRLRALLAMDGDDGPRSNVRSRGFYLNILV
jgi:hypothetical protein